jgi:crotonobetainyl-CoA:carnitine CoA-transferase CaiB-like acyl-CoA transferase
MTGWPGGILDGVKVLELAQNAAIPHCGRLLAGLGADVVKVEPPGGDAMRILGQLGPLEAKAYAVINPGKRSIAVDLAAAGAGDVIDALFRWADVALVAFKGPDLDRYDIGWDHARNVNPRLVHLTHTPFGPAGPDADQGGYDVLVQGRSGVGFIMNRSEDGVPLPTRPAINDFGTGMVSALGVLAGLRHRDLTGEGQRVDTSLLGTAMSLGTAILGRFDAVDAEPLAELADDLRAMRRAGADFDTQREVYEGRVLAGQGAFHLYFRHYRTADGLVSVAGLSAGLFAKFHELTGLPTPDVRDPTSPRFRSVVEAAEALFATRTTADWMAILRAGGYPCSPYNLPHEALDDPQVRANDFAVDLEHPVFGTYTTTGMPLSFEKAPSGVPGPSPAFAAHTVEVLGEAGLEPGHIAELVDAGVVIDGSGDGVG